MLRAQAYYKCHTNESAKEIYDNLQDKDAVKLNIMALGNTNQVNDDSEEEIFNSLPFRLGDMDTKAKLNLLSFVEESSD